MVTDVMAPVLKRVRAYFAPVNRLAQQATIFDPAQEGDFVLEAPPAPWSDLGWIRGFARTSETSVRAVKTGSPATTGMQARSDIEVKVSFAFESWGKLQLALASGTQQMNLLAVQPGAAAAGSGGVAVTAIPLQAGSTATSLNVGMTAAGAFAVGMLVAVDNDYTAGQTGFLGSGVSGAYARSALSDVDYTRRVTLNVGRISQISNGALMLETALLGGAPTATMKVSSVVGFCDREGSSFFQEWSALFVGEGQQGERVMWHYPRLQAIGGIGEDVVKSAAGYESVGLAGSFRALPVIDPVDGERVVCFRSYLAS